MAYVHAVKWSAVQWSALISLTNNNTTRGAPLYITKDFNEPCIAARQPKIQEDCVTLRFIKWIQTRPAHSRQLSMFFIPAESVLSVGFARSVMAYDKKVLQMCKNSKKKAFLISLFFSIPAFFVHVNITSAWFDKYVGAQVDVNTDVPV